MPSVQPILPPGRCIFTADRTIRVHFRIDRPTVAILENMLDPSECDALIALAQPQLAPAQVLDPATGKARTDANRRSQAVTLPPTAPAWVASIEQRAAQVMGMPVAHGEALQVVHYLVGGEYKPHHDYFSPHAYDPRAAHLAQAGQRLSTLIMYLNDVPAGGETYFPQLKLAVQARRGWALYFENCDTLGECAPLTLHGGAPVLQGEKWIATKWMRQRPFSNSF